jgi:hypothetical protein
VLTDSPHEAVRTIVSCYQASCAEAQRHSDAARTGGMRRDRADARARARLRK